MGMNLFASFLDVEAENEFYDDTSYKDDDGRGIIIWRLGVDDFLDGLNESGGACVEDDSGDDEGGHVLNATVAIRMFFIGGLVGEFGANDGNDTR